MSTAWIDAVGAPELLQHLLHVVARLGVAVALFGVTSQISPDMAERGSSRLPGVVGAAAGAARLS